MSGENTDLQGAVENYKVCKDIQLNGFLTPGTKLIC